MAARIVVVGSANTDLVCLMDRLPAPGETVGGGRFVQAAGGKGANQAVAAARLGAEVTFVSRLGDDDNGRTALAGYQREGIDTRHIQIDAEAPSGVALILVQADGENQIAVAPGANGRLSAADVAAAAPAFASADVVLVQLEVPDEAVAAAVAAGHQAGAAVILNPAPARPLPADLLSLVSVLTPNETEAAALGARPSAGGQADAAALTALGCAAVVLTRGAAGALVVEAGVATTVPTIPVTAVDATAAGDAFNGALAVALAEGANLIAAARWACAAGALAATREGAQPSLPTRVEVDDALQRAAR